MNLRSICFPVLSSTLVLIGCAANLEYAKWQGVKQISEDMFEVFSEDHRGVFGSDESNQRYVLDAANDFAEKQGKRAVPVEARKHRVGILGDWGWAYYRFRLLPNAGRITSMQIDHIVFEGDARMSNDFLATRSTVGAVPKAATISDQPGDLYDELIKLDELRKRGILTDSEFDAQKKKLLQGH